MADFQRGAATMERFRPLTEGYQPGSQLQKGYASTPTPTVSAPKPPTGGSSAFRPAQAPAAAAGKPAK